MKLRLPIRFVLIFCFQLVSVFAFGQTVGGTAAGDDFDGDGIINSIDLDDDNDGIPDTDEYCKSSILLPATNTIAAITEQRVPTGWTITNSSPDIATTASSIYSGWVGGCTGVAPAAPNGHTSWVNFYSNTQEAFKTIISGLTIGKTYILKAYYAKFASTPALGRITVKLGTTVIDQYTPTLGCGWETRFITFTATSTSHDLQFQNTGIASPMQNASVSISADPLYEVCDTDNDGLSNQFDLDSDGDGCTDAKEGNVPGTLRNGDVKNGANGGVVTTTTNMTGAISGGVGTYGANGLANEVETIAESGIINYISSYTNYALSANLNTCTGIDTDGDGVSDLTDLDDDNDGILDITEGYGCAALTNDRQIFNDPVIKQFNLVVNGDFEQGDTGFNTTYVNVGSIGTCGSYIVAPFGWASSVGSLSEGNALQINADCSSPFTEFWSQTITVKPNTNYKLGFSIKHGNPATVSYSINGGALTGNFATTANWVSKQSIINSGSNTSLLIKLFETSGAPNSADFIADDIFLIEVKDVYCSGSMDTDNDGIFNHLDLDSDGDGCPDAKEAGVSGTLNSGAVKNGFNGAVTSTTTLNDAVAAGPYGSNGLANGVETSAESGSIRYFSKYTPFALAKNLSVCSDFDNDGIADPQDIDDDNDGTLDAVESPSCFYSSRDWLVGLRSDIQVSTDLVMSNSYQSPKELVDGDNGTTTASWAVSFVASTTPAKTVYAFKMPMAVELKTIYLGYINANTHFNANTVLRLEGSNDNSSWTILGNGYSAVTSVPGVVGVANANSFTVTQNTGKYLFYRIYWVSGGGVGTTGYTNEVYFETLDTYIPSVNPKINCSGDTDGDGFFNFQDLDSDADGCSDALEAGATTNQTANFQFSFNSPTNDANNNGLIDTKEGVTAGTINYNSYYNSYALTASINACLDSDQDGVNDVVDLDDDNDGILDRAECDMRPGKILFAGSNENFSTMRSSLFDEFDNNKAPGATIVQSNIIETSTVPAGFYDGYDMVVFGGAAFNTIHANHWAALQTAIQNKTSKAFIIQSDNCCVVANQNGLMNVLNNVFGTKYDLSASHPAVDQTFTLNNANSYSSVFTTNALDGNNYYPILNVDPSDILFYSPSVAGSALAGMKQIPGTSSKNQFVAWFVDGTITQGAPWYTANQNKIASAFYNAYSRTTNLTCDTDADGVANHLDLDSDGDGCADALESGITSSVLTSGTAVNLAGSTILSGTLTSTLSNAVVATVGSSATTFGNNGFANSLETSNESGVYNSTYNYPFAISKNYAACADFDQDGVTDIVDIDDDNDGVLDAVESPACFYTAAGMGLGSTDRTGILKITSDLTLNSVSRPLTNMIDNPLGTTILYTDFLNAQTAVNKNVVTVEFPRSVKLSEFTFNYNSASTIFGASSSAKLRGSNDGINWFDLVTKSLNSTSETGNITKFTVSTNADKYKYYRVYSTAGTLVSAGQLKDISFTAPSYNASEYPTLACEVDDDEDGIFNHQDLDSDGDGCNDASEAIVTLFNTTVPLTGNFGANGFLNTLETGTESGIYSGTYSYSNAKIAYIKACLDTDGDLVPDIIDIDDDNDGVTDIEEGNFCLPQGTIYIGPTYFKSVTAQNFTVIGTTATPLSDMTDGNIAKSVTGNFNWTNQANPLVIDITLNFPVIADGFFIANDNGVVGDGIKNANIKLYNQTNQLIAQQSISPILNGATGAGNDLYDKYAFSKTYVGVKRMVLEVAYSGITTGAAAPNYQIREIGMYRDDANCTDRDTDLDGTPDQLDADSDNDGCNDAYEAGAVSSNVTTVAGTYGVNGLSSLVETSDLVSAITNYASSYNFLAIQSGYNKCTDSDNDGVIDLDDIDDDNDGILDISESPSCFFNIADWNTKDKSNFALISSDLATTTNVFNSSLLTDNLTTDPSSITFSTTTAQSQIGKSIYKVNFFKPVKLDAWYIQKTSATQIFATTAGSLMVQGSNDNSTWTNLLSSAIASPADATNTAANGAISLPNSNKFTISANAGYYKYYRIFGVGSSAANILGGSAEEFFFDINPSSYNAGIFPTASCLTDTDGDGIPNHRDLDSDGDACPDAKESGVKGTLTTGNVVNLLTINAAPGTATATTNNVASAVASSTYGANGFADALETATESGLYSGTYFYEYAINKSISGCIDSDGDGINDVFDLDDDNDGILDTQEQISCYTYGVNLDNVTFNGTAVTSKTSNSITTSSPAWISSYSTENFSLPLSLKFYRLSTDGGAMFGLLPAANAQKPSSYDDLGHKFNIALGQAYGYFNGGVWSFAHGAVTGSEEYSIDISSTGYVTVKINGVQKQAYQGTASDYKLAVTAGSSSMLISNIRLTNAANPEKSFCFDRDTDGDGTPNRLDLDSDGDGCSDAFEAGTTTDRTQNFAHSNAGVGGNGFSNNLETVVDNGIYSGTYTLLNVLDRYKKACLDTDGDNVSDLVDLDDDNDGVLDSEECQAPVFDNWIDLASFKSKLMSSAFHGTLFRSAKGNYYVAGQYAKPDGTDQTTPTLVTPANGYNYTGEIIDIAAVGSNSSYAIATTKGIWVWGYLSTNFILPGTSSTGASPFQQVTLPSEIDPKNIKSISASTNNFMILLQDGTVYTYGLANASINGAGLSAATKGFTKVLVAENTPLTNISQIEATSGGSFAANATNNKLYTWGTNVYLGNGSATSTKNYATEMINPLPNGTSIAMIDATYSTTMTYLLLGSDRKVYSLGSGSAGILGQNGTTNSTSWLNVKGKDGVGVLQNVDYLSAQNSTDGYPSASVILTNGQPLSWGDAGGNNMIGLGNSSTLVPKTPDGITDADIIYVIENGGHLTPMLNNKGEIGNVGHNVAGSFADGSTTNRSVYVFNTFERGSDLSDNIASSCNPDIDGDGIPNRLDLDTDGDGCSDAKEAGVKGTLLSGSLQNKVNGVLTTFTVNNAIAQGTYGNNGFANSIETSSESGAYSGTYAYDFATDATVSACADADNDGVADINDLDDDNDGILDTIECPSLAPYTLYTYNYPTTSNASNVPVSVTGRSTQNVILDQRTNGSFSYNTINNWKLVATNIKPSAANTIKVKIAPTASTAATYVFADAMLITNGVNTYIIDNNSTNTDGFLIQGAWAQQNVGNAYLGTNSYLTSPAYAGNTASWTFSNIASATTCDFDGDGIANNLDLDSDGDGCPDAKEANVKGALTSGNVVNLVNYNAGAGTATSTTNNVDNAIAAGAYGSNGFADAIETTTESGVYSFTYAYRIAINRALNGCLDSDNDNVSDVLDLDDDNDGILDSDESTNCIATGIDLNTLVMSGSAVTAKSSNSFTTAGGDGWKSSYSDKNLKLPISLKFKNNSTTGYSMFGLIPAATTQTPTTWTDGGYKFYPQNSLLYGYFTSTWDPDGIALSKSDVLGIDISTTGYVTVTVNGINKKSYQGTLSDYKLVVSSYRATTLSEILLSDALTPLQYNCTDQDTDVDGIPNRLDLDSDGDNCPDAREAGVKGTLSSGSVINRVNGNNVTTSVASAIAIGTYGDNGFANSIETTTESGLYSGTYTYFFATDAAVSVCLDTDADGVTDMVDLDDDNDGVLDIVECPLTNILVNGDFTGNTTGWTANANWVWKTGDFVWNSADNVSNNLISQTFAKPIFNAESSNVDIAFDVNTNGTGWSITSSGTATLDVILNNTTYATITNPNGGTTASVVAKNGAIVNVSSINIVATNVPSTKIIISVPRTVFSNSNTIGFNFGATVDDIGIDNVFIGTQVGACDTDADGKVNSKDLDSDGDGCSDASESKTVSSLTATTVSGAYGNNGFANSIETATESGLYSGTYFYSRATDPTIKACLDSDYDGVPDLDDVDDDNDGILDSNECPTAALNTNESNGTFGTAAAPRNVSNTTISGGYVYSGSNTGAGQYAIINQSTAYHPSATFWRYVGHTTGAANDAYLAVNGSTTVGIFYTETVNLQATVKYRISFWHQAASAANDYALAAELVNGSNTVLATASTGAQNSLGWKLTTIDYTSPTNQAVTFRIKNTSVNASGNDFSIDDISITPIGCPDTDGDGIPNQLDLDSDGDGCSDANEAYGLTTAQGTDGNQYFGNSPLTVDATGKVSGATYTATSVNVLTAGSASTITVQPTDQSINVGGTAVFSTALTAGSGTTSYQWQVSSNGGTTWSNVTNSSTYAGAGTTTLTVSNVPLSMKGFRYRLNVAQSNYVCGNITSSVARLTMDNTPIVVDDNATITEDTPISGNVLTNDRGSGIPAAGITVTNFIINNTTYTAGQTASISGFGSITINTDGSYTFTPTTNYNGTLPLIEYTATDANGGTDVGALNITVTPVNDAPVAVDDIKTTNENTAASGNVLTDGIDDSDVDGNSLTITEFKIGALSYNPGSPVSIPGVGTILLTSSGSYTFTPTAGYTGSVPGIDYKISDGNGGSDTGTLSITVNNVNDAPLATDDIVTMLQGGTISGTLTSNDTDVDPGTTLTVTSYTIDGITGPFPLEMMYAIAGKGWVTISASGNYTFTADPNYSGTVPHITYTVSDGTSTDTAILDIFVAPVNAAPVAVDDAKSTPEDTPVSDNVLTNDTDANNGDTKTVIGFTVGGQTYPAGSTAIIAGVGTIVINTNGSYTFSPFTNYNGTVPTVSYTVSDGRGGTDSGDLVISVSAMNDNPIAVNDDNKTTPEDTPVTVNVLLNDSDPDGGTTLSITQFIIAGISGTFTSTATIPSKGTITALSTGEFTFTPFLNFNGVVPTITYTVSDGTATNTANFNLTVTPVNDAPVVVNETLTTLENTPLAGNLLSNDTDVESNTLSITQFTIAGVGTATASTYPAGSIVDIPNVGTVIVNADGTFTFTPVRGYFGTPPVITYAVSDGNGGVTNGTLAITVTPVNDPPIVVNESVQIQEDAVATGNLLTNDTDPENNPLTITQFTIAGISGTFTSTASIPGVGTITINANGTYTFTPTANYNGIVPVIEYTVSDGLGGNTTGNLTIVVAAVNDAPIVANDTKSAPVNTAISDNVLTNDRDIEASTLSLTKFTIAGVDYTAGTTATITGVGTIVMNADGTFTFTPATNYVGSAPVITYTVSDGTATSTGTLSLTITPIDADGDGIPDEIEKGPGSTPRDTDNDGTPDYLDTDSDGDGILDNEEDAVCVGFMPCTPTDTDSDGTPDYRDLDSDGDGIPDAMEGTTDTDGDGVPNYRDTDSDGDGILDSVEGTTDTDSDGIPNYKDLDSDGDGIPDATEGTTDTDGDGTPNYKDLDSDGDGISDAIEGTTDTDGDGTPNYIDTDSDGDGISDAIEKGPTATPVDTDGDGTPDYKDLDSDNDGILDSAETATDTDGDGIANFRDLDSDGDGILDSVEGTADTDADGTPNYLDTDSDGDGIPDSIEKGPGSVPVDTDGDGTPDFKDVDTDGDGIPDAVEDVGCTGTAPCTPTDTDGDGTPNFRDLDSDGDGISDALEKGPNGATPVDTDGDGTPDYLDLDSDADGISDAIEKGPTATPVDTDGDGIPDFRDTDSDNDGISDLIEKGPTATPVDTDNDGTPDYRDLDSDGDGKSDQSEGNVDTDGDGTPNFRDLDSDGDGVLDAVDVCPLISGLGSANGCPPDSDGDGLADVDDSDDDNDGILDTVEAAACSPAAATCDTDGDGIPNILDTDSDGDGITDVKEAGGTDTDNNGIADGNVDSNGVPSSANGGVTPPNTDGTGNTNPYDIDSDGDGISDAIEKGSGATLADTDNDNIPDYLDTDSDGDGISDAIEKGTGTAVADTDNDGIPDFRDLDSDGDGIPDATEGTTDSDNDGTPNFRDVDSDGDGILDSIEDAGCTGITPCTPTNSDNDNIPDYLDQDSDNDGIPDAIEGTVDTDIDGTPDYLDTDSDGDGILDSVEDEGCTGTAPCVPTDTDGDGVPNFRDLDSDGDGITDAIEGTTDTDGDLLPNYLDPDSDGDGISDLIEGNVDTDGDGTPNYKDLDSDGDGIPDSIEKGTATLPADTDGDGTPDYLDTDTDGDGIPDSVEDAACSGTTCTPTDTDNDGIPNHKDLDSDGDGIPDSVERGANGATPDDTDSLTLPDYLDTDSDNDGILDAVERGIDGNNPLDTDGDGIPDYKEVDSDNDGIPDAVEGTVDTDGDGIPDYRDTDSDNDGILDATEDAGCTGTAPCTPTDTDNDGIPNYRDLDSDGDNKSDRSEGETDYDGDSIPNYLDPDSDGDGINDIVDQCPLLPGIIGNNGCPVDTDSDGVYDMDDADDDNDGLLDTVEAGVCSPTAPDCDTDNDGIPNRLDPDSDNDGISDVRESNGTDVDGDGKVDGTVDANGVPSSTNGGLTPPNTDGTTLPDPYDLDSDGDGIPDSLEGTVDTDGDGIPNYRDLDSDADGIPDSVERGTGAAILDTDGDGTPDYKDLDSDGDGITDSVEKGPNGATPLDTDNDGIPNYRDTDSDGDGIPDNIEGTIDTDGDGIPNYRDTDSDGDGILDSIEKGLNGNSPIDTDGDGVPDYRDLDSDNDGIPDSVEGALDRDGDGVPNYRDLDSDGDGISDAIEKGPNGLTPVDTDLDGTPDYLDLDSDGDGKSDAIEKGTGPTLLDTDRDGIPDYRDVDNYGKSDFNVTNANVPVSGNVKTNDAVPTGTTYGQPAALAGATLVMNATTGTYTFTSTTPGKYVYYIPVCGPGQTSNCPQTPLVITVLDPLAVDKPAANNDFAILEQGSAATVALLANDKAGDLGKSIDVASLVITTAPGHGTAVVNSNGTITYTPSAFFVGVDSLVYRVCDTNVPSQCQSATAYFTIEPAGVLVSTGAVDDFAILRGSTDGSTSVAGNVLSNDLNGAGASLTANLISGPSSAQGTFTMNASGNYTFTAAPGFSGPVDIVYEACGGSPVVCTKATLHILVDPLPALVNDATTAFANVPKTGDLSTNESVPAGTTYGQPTQVTGATITVGPSGTYTFTATVAGTYSYTIPVCAPGQTSNCPTETLVITVTAPGPIDDTATAFANVLKTGDISTNDANPAGTTFGQPTQLTGATITVDASGTYTFTATAAGTYTYTIPTCAPGQTSNCPTQTLVITVTAPGPVDDVASALVNTPATGNVATNDNNPAGTTFSQPAPVEGATIVVNPDGTYIFSARVAGTYTYTIPTCAPGQTSSCPTQTLVINVTDPTIPYTAPTTNPDIDATNINVPVSGNVSTNDASGATYGQPAALSGATIVVNPNGTYRFAATIPGVYTYVVPVCPTGQTTNCPTMPLVITVSDPLKDSNSPVANTDVATVNTGSSVTTKVLANDKSANPGAVLNPASLAIVTNGANGTAVVNADGTITYTPKAGFFGVDEITYKVCDNSTPALCSTAKVVYTIQPAAEPAKTFAADDYNSTSAGSAVMGSVLGNDGNTAGESLTATLTSGPTATEGTLVFNLDGSYAFTPAPGFSGPVDVVYTVCSAANVCAKATLHLVVNPPAVLIPDFNATLVKVPLQGNVATNDVVAAGSIYGQPKSQPGATLQMNPNGTYTFESSTTGTYEYQVPVCPKGQTTNCPTIPLIISVTDPYSQTNAPVVNPDIVSVAAGTPVTTNVVANDQAMNDGKVLVLGTLAIVNAPTNGTAKVNADGTITYTPAPGFVGLDILTYTICDNSEPAYCKTAKVYYSVGIATGNNLSASDDFIISKGGTVGGNVLANDKSSTGSALTASLISNVDPAKGTFTLSPSGEYKFTPSGGYVGPVDIIYSVCSADGLCTKATLHITVLPVPEMIAPQAITPNGDGKNDTLIFRGLPGLNIENRLTIYNRWGNIVFSVGNYQNNWSGQTDNAFSAIASDSQLPDGTYYYVLDFFGSRPSLSNYVYLDRSTKE